MLNLRVTYCSPKLDTLTTTIKSLQMKLHKRKHCSSIFNKKYVKIGFGRLSCSTLPWSSSIYPLVMTNSLRHRKWPSRNSGFPIKNGDFPSFFVCLPGRVLEFPQSGAPTDGFPQATLAEIEHSYGDTSKNATKKKTIPNATKNIWWLISASQL